MPALPGRGGYHDRPRGESPRGALASAPRIDLERARRPGRPRGTRTCSPSWPACCSPRPRRRRDAAQHPQLRGGQAEFRERTTTTVETGPDGPYLAARYHPPFDTMVRGVEAPHRYHRTLAGLRWRWRVRAFPKGGDDCNPDVGDAAAGVFATFKAGLKVMTIKYVWNSVGPVSRSCELANNWFFAKRVVVLRSGGAPTPGTPRRWTRGGTSSATSAARWRTSPTSSPSGALRRGRDQFAERGRLRGLRPARPVAPARPRRGAGEGAGPARRCRDRRCPPPSSGAADAQSPDAARPRSAQGIWQFSSGVGGIRPVTWSSRVWAASRSNVACASPYWASAVAAVGVDEVAAVADPHAEVQGGAPEPAAARGDRLGGGLALGDGGVQLRDRVLHLDAGWPGPRRRAACGACSAPTAFLSVAVMTVQNERFCRMTSAAPTVSALK